MTDSNWKPKFVAAFKRLLIAKAAVKAAEAALEEIRPTVSQLIAANGEPNREDTEQRIVEWNGWKVQWTYKDSKPKLDQEKLVAWARENAPKMIVRVPQVPREKWESLKALKQVPQAVINAVETDTTGYYLLWWLSAEGECPKCGQTIGPKDDYCKHCGIRIDRGEKKGQKKLKTAA